VGKVELGEGCGWESRAIHSFKPDHVSRPTHNRGDETIKMSAGHRASAAKLTQAQTIRTRRGRKWGEGRGEGSCCVKKKSVTTLLHSRLASANRTKKADKRAQRWPPSCFVRVWGVLFFGGGGVVVAKFGSFICGVECRGPSPNFLRRTPGWFSAQTHGSTNHPLPTSDKRSSGRRGKKKPDCNRPGDPAIIRGKNEISRGT